jgi:UDP-N-acetylglucosamine:LPS N-acetylglucosamine transferase
MLPSSHQPKNAKVLADIDAAVVLSDDRLAERPQLLTQVIKDLLGDDKKRLELASNLHQLAKPHAARDLAEIIVKAAK